MLQNLWKKKNKNTEKTDKTGTNMPWDDQATQALNQSVSQAPVPQMLKNKLKKELVKAAEGKAKKAGHDKVTAEDLMQGLMDKLPPNMKKQFEDAAAQGPEGIQNLQKKLRRR